MRRLIRCAIACAAILLAGCAPLHDRHVGAGMDDDEDLGDHNAAAFLGYHGPVARTHSD